MAKRGNATALPRSPRTLRRAISAMASLPRVSRFGAMFGLILAPSGPADEPFGSRPSGAGWNIDDRDRFPSRRRAALAGEQPHCLRKYGKACRLAGLVRRASIEGRQVGCDVRANT